MENFNLDNFDPTTAQLQTLAESYKWLTIKKDWLEIVKEAKKDIQSKRIFISKTLKADRDKAIKYQKDNIAKEKELIWLIAPVEKMFDDDLLALEMEEEMNKRKESLQIRRDELRNIWLEKEYTEEFLLTMNRSQFMSFIDTEKARLYQIELDKKRESEAEVKRLADLKEAEERGRLQAEQRAKEEAEQKEKDRLNEEARKEDMKVQADLQTKLDKETEEKRLADEQAKMEKATKYKKWLKENWYTEEEKELFKIDVDKENWKVILWKFISEFKI